MLRTCEILHSEVIKSSRPIDSPSQWVEVAVSVWKLLLQGPSRTGNHLRRLEDWDNLIIKTVWNTHGKHEIMYRTKTQTIGSALYVLMVEPPDSGPQRRAPDLYQSNLHDTNLKKLRLGAIANRSFRLSIYERIVQSHAKYTICMLP